MRHTVANQERWYVQCRQILPERLAILQICQELVQDQIAFEGMDNGQLEFGSLAVWEGIIFSSRQWW